jgi:predicted Rossmann-fold nucleotide-binding protein
MIRTLISTLAAAGLVFAGGCASQMESANRGANQAGQAAGGVMRLPNSVSEGAAQGVAGQPNANPYGR